MDKKALGLTLLTVIFLLLGFAFSYFFQIQTPLAETPFTAIVIGFFLAGTIYFGYLTFIPGLIFGLQLGAEKNAAIFLYLIPIIIATYAGTKLGSSLQEDFLKKKSFLEDIQIIILILFLGVLLALMIEAALPALMEVWPKDFLGMNVTQGKGIAGMIDSISSRLLRR
jgi:hypothetical protein